MTMPLNGALKRDDNEAPVMGGTSSVDDATIVNSAFDPVTRRLLTDSAGGGTGTVTSVSVVSANGLAGTVATATTTPAITLSTTITGILKGNGTAISAATAGTDYTALAFKTISVAGQSDVVADSAADTLTLVGSGVTITTNATTDTITFTSSGAPGGSDKQIQFNDGSSFGGVANTTWDKTAKSLDWNSVSDTGYFAFYSANAAETRYTYLNVTPTTVTLDQHGTGGGKYQFGNSGSLLGILDFSSITSTNKTYTFPDATGTIALTSQLGNLTVGTSTIASGTTTRILYDNAGVLGEYTLTGTGTVVAMGTSPVFTTGITSPQVLASSNDSGALGASGTAFADLFLASGGVINWAANNSNITHSTGILTVGAGELRITSANVGTNADSVPTLSSTSTLTNKTLNGVTFSGTVDLTGATTQVKAVQVSAGGTSLMAVPTVDGTATGPTTSAFVSGYTSSAVGDLVILDSSGKWQKTDANTASIYNGMLGIALAVAATDAALLVALPGSFVYATAFPTMTIGAAMYMSETAGAITATAPTTTDSATRIIGYAFHADKIFFNPSNDWITHT